DAEQNSRQTYTPAHPVSNATAGIRAALRDLVRRGRFCLRHEENDDVDKDYTRSRTGGCCHHRHTGICWKLLWAVQPQLGLLTLSWGEHVLESPSNLKTQ